MGGDPEARHGIILAKDQLAKEAGVKTGMALWQARECCPGLQIVPPRMLLYSYTLFNTFIHSKIIVLMRNPNDQYTADCDSRNTFNIEAFLSHKLTLKPEDIYEVVDVDESA